MIMMRMMMVIMVMMMMMMMMMTMMMMMMVMIIMTTIFRTFSLWQWRLPGRELSLTMECLTISSQYFDDDHDDDDDDDGDDDDRAGKYCTDGADYDFQPRYRDDPLGPPRAGQYLQVPYPVQHHQV